MKKPKPFEWGQMMTPKQLDELWCRLERYETPSECFRNGGGDSIAKTELNHDIPYEIDIDNNPYAFTKYHQLTAHFTEEDIENY